MPGEKNYSRYCIVRRWCTSETFRVSKQTGQPIKPERLHVSSITTLLYKSQSKHNHLLMLLRSVFRRNGSHDILKPQQREKTCCWVNSMYCIQFPAAYWSYTFIFAIEPNVNSSYKVYFNVADAGNILPNCIILCDTVQQEYRILYNLPDPKCCFTKIIVTDVHEIYLKNP